MGVLRKSRYHATTRYQTFDERVMRLCGIIRQPAADATVEWRGATFSFSGGEVSDFRIMPPMPQGETSYFDAPLVRAEGN